MSCDSCSHILRINLFNIVWNLWAIKWDKCSHQLSHVDDLNDIMFVLSSILSLSFIRRGSLHPFGCQKNTTFLFIICHKSIRYITWWAHGWWLVLFFFWMCKCVCCKFYSVLCRLCLNRARTIRAIVFHLHSDWNPSHFLHWFHILRHKSFFPLRLE